VNRFATIQPLLGVALVLSSLEARAEASPPVSMPARQHDTGPAATPPRTAPEPHTGFQAAFRTGLLFPVGDATAATSDSLGSRYAWQVPLVVDLGAKIIESLFVGAYLGGSLGSTGSDSALEAACNDDDDDLENDISCSSYTARAGLEAIYGFQPGERVNPWVGYGFGFESASATLTDNERGYSETVSMSGFTFAQLSAGLDLRHPSVGAGPFVEGAVGQYTKSSTEIDGERTSSGPIDERALHTWLMFGLRIVVNP
jgi:hypothetical protein